MAGKHDFLHGTEEAPDLLQAEVLQRNHVLATEAGELGSLEHVPAPEAALRELLKGRSDYQQPDIPVALAPYRLERVSLPTSLHGLPQAEELLPDDTRRYLQGEELMLKDGAIEDAPRPYWDPVLAKSQKHYKEFIRKLDSIGMLQYTQKPKNEVGIFFVYKSDRQRIRLIVDARSANVRFKDPPGVSLCSSEGFSRIECQLSEHARPGTQAFVDELQAMNIHIGLSDVKDCFHRLKQPRWLAEYFCLKPIRASWVNLGGTTLDGVALKDNDIVYPMPGSLCMGFSWSLFFAQKINEYQCSLTKSLTCSRIISDKGDPVVFSSPQSLDNLESSTRHYVYVDNLGILSPHEAVVHSSLQELDQHFGSSGLLLHPGEVSGDKTKALGTILDGKNLCSKITQERFHRVRQAIRGLLRRGRSTGQSLEVLIGHATFCGLNNRMLLAVFHTCYKFIRRHYFDPSTLWDSVRNELRAFAGLMIFLRSDWWRPWNDLVCCSDASTTGFGVCTSFWKREDVMSVGRVKERCRFKRSSSHSAREASLTSAGFVRDSVTGQWRAGEIDGTDYLEQSGWELVDNFPEVPARLLHKDLWVPRLWGKWSFEESILILEARAAAKALRRVAMSVFGNHVRQLFLFDNMSLVLALERSRSRQFGLLKRIRLFNSYCIARGIQPSFRWLPSELNNADEPSRYDTLEESKLLTGLIRDVSQTRASVEAAAGPTEPKQRLKVPSPETWKDECQPSNQNEDEGSQGQSFGEKVQTNHPSSQSSKAGRCPFGHEHQHQQDGQNLGLSVKQLRQQQRARDERHPKAAAGRKSQVPPQTLRGPLDGGEGARRPLPLGAKSSRLSHREDVPERTAELLGLHQTGCFQSRQPRAGGSVFGAAHESAVSRWAPSLQGGPSDCQLSTPLPSVQQSWGQAHSSCAQSTSGMAEAVPWKIQGALSFGYLDRPGLSHDWDGFQRYGNLHHDRPVYICPTIRTPEDEGLQLGAASDRLDRQLECPDLPRRTWRTVEDWRVRCECPVRLSLFELLDFKSPPGLQGTGPDTEPLAIQLQSVPVGLQEVRQPAGPRGDTVPCPAQWPVNRPGEASPVTAGGSEAGSMEVHQECSQVRKGSPTGAQLGAGEPEGKRLLPQLRVRLHGHRLRAQEASKYNLPRRNPKGLYIADLFSGNGGVSAACERLGFCAKEWDIRHGHQCDLTSRNILSVLKRDIKAGKILAVMLAPPCDSFSVARDRIKVIRSAASPWGLPFHLLTSHERSAIKRGNACFKSCRAIINLLDSYEIPWILENPFTSKCWYLPFVQNLVTCSHTHLVIADFCQYSRPWRKRTKFLCGNICSDDLHRLNHRCSGVRTCDRTGRPHFRLTGKGPGGKHWTAIAQAYPTQLCDALAHALTAHLHYNQIHY